MRDDQRQRLAELSEKLTEVVLEEADPAAWPGQGKTVADMSPDERGDRYWCKKNATASISLLLRVQQVIENTPEALGRGQPLRDPEIDNEVKRAERQAAELLGKLQAKAHGKP